MYLFKEPKFEFPFPLDFGSSVVKVMTMFTGELSFETIMVNVTRWDRENSEDIAANIFLSVFYIWFIFEMCVILMNLTIGLSISNIQVR